MLQNVKLQNVMLQMNLDVNFFIVHSPLKYFYIKKGLNPFLFQGFSPNREIKEREANASLSNYI